MTGVQTCALPILESGAADLGVTGTDILRETGADVLEPLELGFGACRLVVATPAASPYPALPGGITAREALRAVRRLAWQVGLAGMEVVEVSPPYDHAEITALLANRLVLEAIEIGRASCRERV